MSALEMVVTQDRASHDWQIGVGTQEIMRELFDKIKELAESCLIYFHWNMLTVENDAVFVVINVWRILEAPVAAIDCDRNNAVVFASWMVDASCITLVFHAEQTLWIAACLGIFGSRDGFWIFLRFGKIDGDVNCTIVALDRPAFVFAYAVATDIVTVLAELVEVISGSLWALLIFFCELLLYLSRSWHQAVHQFGIK